MTITSHELLATALESSDLAHLAAAVRAAVGVRMKEDHLVDFKAGPWLAEKDATDQVRRMVCGFANADGGVLVIGVTEKDENGVRAGRAQSIAPCGAGAFEQVNRALGAVASARARVHELDIDGASVVLVSVPRSPALLTYWQGGAVQCFLRIGESTHPVPEHLRLDLVLGRRERPALSLHGEIDRGNGGPGPEFSTIVMLLRVSNDSLVWADRVRLGVLGFGAHLGNESTRPIGGDLLLRTNAIDVPSRRERLGRRHPERRHVVKDVGNLGPFEASEVRLSVQLPAIPARSVWSGAAYVVTPDAGVSLYTVRVTYSDEQRSAHDFEGEVKRNYESRPLVWWGPQDAFFVQLFEADREIR